MLTPNYQIFNELYFIELTLQFYNKQTATIINCYVVIVAVRM